MKKRSERVSEILEDKKNTRKLLAEQIIVLKDRIRELAEANTSYGVRTATGSIETMLANNRAENFESRLDDANAKIVELSKSVASKEVEIKTWREAFRVLSGGD